MPAICTFVPVNVGCDTEPPGVPATEISPSVPVNVAVYVFGTGILPVTSLAPVPVKVGCVTDLTDVATVVLLPFVGRVP